MRNFTVAFMILILFLSITFAIFKPMPAQEKPKTTDIEEKSYVEKLVTEPNATLNSPREESLTSSKQTPQAETDLVSGIKEKTIVQEETQPQVEQRALKNDKIELPQKQNSNYDNVSQELSNKYHNDPNAVVSDEDFNYFMQKMIEQSTQK